MPVARHILIVPLCPVHKVGFGHNTVASVADTVVGAIKGGDLKHIFLIGGCDGSEGERSYFRDLALATPKDSLILTVGCGKYRFNKHDVSDRGRQNQS